MASVGIELNWVRLRLDQLVQFRTEGGLTETEQAEFDGLLDLELVLLSVAK